MILSSSHEVAGHRIVKTHGLARGNTLRARHIGRDIMAGLRGIVGGEITDYTKMLAEAREQALDRMIEEARALDANAVVAICKLSGSAISTIASPARRSFSSFWTPLMV